MQTNMDQFVRVRKRPATDELPGYPSKMVVRKLFDATTPSSLSEPSSELESLSQPARPSTPTQSSSTHESVKQPSKPSTPSQSSSAQETSEEPTRPATPTQSPSTQESLKEKLNLGEFKKVIRQNKKYSLLKKKLEKFNASTNRLKSIEESLSGHGSPELKKFDNVQVEVPSSPVKCGTLKPRRLFWTSPVQSPVKSNVYLSPKKLLDEGPKQVTPVKASFEKYNHLLAAGKEALILPHKYLVLKEIFRSLDIITKIKNDRNEAITFDKLQKDVQKMLRKNFTENHLGKIKAVYPESYEFSRERMRVTFSNEEKYELIIRRLPHTIVKGNQSEPRELTNSERLKIFHNRLLDRTKSYHQEFLSNLDTPITVEPNKIKLWHPEFELDSVPDIEPIKMPQPPTSQNNMSAKAILEKTHEMISLNHRMERAVSAMPDQKIEEPEIKVNPNTPSTPEPILALQKALRGVPKALLEKIRAKQAAKMAETLTQTPAEAKESIMLSRLPELARIMRNVFVSEKKCVLPVEVVVQKVGHSYKEKLTNNDLMEHMKMIVKHVPGWMNFFTIRNIPYIRLSKDADMTRVLGKLQTLANPVQ